MNRINFAKKILLLAIIAGFMISFSYMGAFAHDETPTLANPVIKKAGENEVSIKLSGVDADWVSGIQKVTVDGKELTEKSEENTANTYEIKEEKKETVSYTLVIDSKVFNKIPKRSNKYQLVIKSKEHDDLVSELTVKNFGAEKLIVRHLDKEGQVLKSKIYTMDDLQGMIDANKEGTLRDALYQGVCTHRGVTSYRATGLTVDSILSDAGIAEAFKPGTELRLRTNDGNKEAVINDDENDNDSYYARGSFSYEYLNTKRYTFNDIYSERNPELAEKLAAHIKESTMGDGMRRDLTESGREEVKPMIALEFSENQTRRTTSMPGTDYKNTKEDKAFRFLYGISLDPKNADMISKEETTFSQTYFVYGIDIVDSQEHAFNPEVLEIVIKQGESLKAANYTKKSWDDFYSVLEESKLFIKRHNTNQKQIAEQANKLKSAMEKLELLQKKIKSAKLSKSMFVYNGKNVKPQVVIVGENGEKLNSNDYNIRYPKNSKNVGKYLIKVSFKGRYKNNKVKTLKYKICPKGTEIVDLRSRKKKLTIRWKKNRTQTTGYEIQYSVSSKFKNTKTVKIKSNRKTSLAVKKLKKGKRYNIRIRTYSKTKGGMLYSSWSKNKRVKIK
ncbi:MAG: fibronectin type III domain-containing protein [Hornefia sp.]|nr:fibronectin type III domain-containing protein [Hornefia sp.]